MAKPRISFYLPNLDGGGAERVMLNLANGIAENNQYEVDLVLAQKAGPLLPDVSKKVRLIDLKATRLITSLPPLVRYLKEVQPNVLVSALNTANCIAIFAKKILPKIKTRFYVTEHNTLSVTASNARSIRARTVPWLISRLYPSSNGIIAVSQGVADDLSQRAKLTRDSIEVIYNPVITPQVKVLCEHDCDDEWINEPSVPTLLGIGRLTPQKDFANLIEAMSHVISKKNARLIILGEGDLRHELQDQINQLNLAENIKLAGFVKNPYSYLSNADLFVLSSRWEGLPTVLIEALYCNCKVVSTDCPSGPCEILNNGSHGVLVEVADPIALASGIIEALDTDKIPNIESTWERYTLEYSISQYLKSFFSDSATINQKASTE